MFRPAVKDSRSYTSSTSFSNLKETFFGKESWVRLASKPVLPAIGRCVVRSPSWNVGYAGCCRAAAASGRLEA